MIFLEAPPPSTPPTFIHASNYSAFITMLKCIGGEPKKRTPFDFEGQIVTDISYVSSVQIQYLRQGWEHRSRWWQPVGERGEQLIILGRCRQKRRERVNESRMKLRENIFWSQVPHHGALKIFGKHFKEDLWRLSKLGCIWLPGYHF